MKYNSCSKLVTYHPFRSTGMGGVETLIRSLHKMFEGEFDRYELFHYTDSNQTFFPNIDGVKPIRLNEPFIRPTKEPTTKIKRLIFHLNFLIAAFHVRKFCREGDVFFTFNSLSCVLASLFKRPGVKVIYVQTNAIDILARTVFWRFILKSAVRLANATTVYTDHDKIKLASTIGEGLERVHVVPRGCKLETSTIPPKFGKNLVCIARIREKQKNFKGLIEVMGALPKEYQLDIYGSGSENEIRSLKKLISKSPNVRYMGPCIDVARTLQRYSVFLMTSRFEGFGQTLIEARSQGLPVVAFNTFESLEWIIRDGRNGYVIEPFDIKEFAKKIIIITENKANFDAMVRESTKLAVETDSVRVKYLWYDVVARTRKAAN